MARHYYAVMHRESRQMLISSRYYADQVRFGDPTNTSFYDWQQWQVAVWTSKEAACKAADLFPDDLTVIMPVRVMNAGIPPQKA